MAERILFFNINRSEYEQFKNESKAGKSISDEVIKTNTALPNFITQAKDVTYVVANCAMCGLSINYNPIFSFKTAARRNGKFEVDLAFHGLSCYRTFLILRKEHKDKEKIAIFESVKGIFYGGRALRAIIPPLPDPIYTLKSYGRGNLSDEQYLEIIAEQDKGIFIE